MENYSPSETALFFQELYRSFNAREIETVLSALAENVEWPNILENTRLHGRDSVREYWLKQWETLDPLVSPLSTSTLPDGLVKVRVHQLVRDKQGNLLADHEVLHVYRLENGLILSMDVAQ
jgi:hypothetical protein